MEAFWASLWGSLVGAVVGATAAWLFALDLRRRDGKDRRGEQYEERMERLWREFAVEIVKYGVAADRFKTWGKLASWRRSHERMLELTHEIRTTARGDDSRVIGVVQERFAWDGYESSESSTIAAVVSELAARRINADKAIEMLEKIVIPDEPEQPPAS